MVDLGLKSRSLAVPLVNILWNDQLDPVTLQRREPVLLSSFVAFIPSTVTNYLRESAGQKFNVTQSTLFSSWTLFLNVGLFFPIKNVKNEYCSSPSSPMVVWENSGKSWTSRVLPGRGCRTEGRLRSLLLAVLRAVAYESSSQRKVQTLHLWADYTFKGEERDRQILLPCG